MFFFAAAGLIVFKIFKIQRLQADKWKELVEHRGIDERIIKSTRGNIYSDNGSLMATSLPFYRVGIDPRMASDELVKEKIDSLGLMLARKFRKRSASGYVRRIKNARRDSLYYVPLSVGRIDHLEKKEMQTWPIFRNGRLKGGGVFDKENRRFFPFGGLAKRTLGFVNENNQGAGLEKSFNHYLAGVDGKAIYRRIAGGRWRPVYDGSEIRPVDGLDITTTLDVNLQDVTETALLKALLNYKADYGCVVLMEVKTGEIKAIANLKRNKKKGTYSEAYNYAVGAQGLTEPGSTFKLASMMALLEDTSLDLEDKVETGSGTYKFHDKIMRDHKPGGYGTLTVQEVFEKSSNIGVSKLVNNHFGHKPERFYNYIRNMGLKEPLHFQLKGEGIPYIKHPNDKTWSGVSLPWMSIGYELQLTPLHTLAFFNAVANGGKMIRPVLVKNVMQANEVLQTFGTKVINPKICSDKTLKKLRTMLEGVVIRGTARNIYDEKVRIAGKTGTAQKVKNGKYTRTYYTSFAGYFPAEKPKYSCIVVIDSPKGYQQYGGDAAAPVFKDIADKIYVSDLELHDQLEGNPRSQDGVFPVIRAGLKPDLQEICDRLGIAHKDSDTDEWVRTSTKGNAVIWQDAKIKPNIVPDVRGMTLRDALYLLENMSLRVTFQGKGRVVTQSLPPKMRFNKEKQIFLTLK